MMMLDEVVIAIVETLMARQLGMGMDAAMEREGFDPIGAAGQAVEGSNDDDLLSRLHLDAVVEQIVDGHGRLARHYWQQTTAHQEPPVCPLRFLAA